MSHPHRPFAHPARGPLPDPAAPFDELTRIEATGPDRFAATVPDGWQQGRGAFGGLVVAYLVRAVEAANPGAGQRLRSLTAELCGPTQPGPVELHTEVLRQGSGTAVVAVRLKQEGAIQAHATAVFGRDRASDCDTCELRPPEQPGWRAIPKAPVGPPHGPEFTRFFEFRTQGPLPFTGEAGKVSTGWIAPANPGLAIDCAYVVGCADAWWPVLFTGAKGPRPMATIAFTIEFLLDPAELPLGPPLQFAAQSIAVAQGHAVEFRELWSEDGRLVALNQQTIAVIR